jgi:hypothetical protein
MNGPNQREKVRTHPEARVRKLELANREKVVTRRYDYYRHPNESGKHSWPVSVTEINR